jgi:hypothetical protein
VLLQVQLEAAQLLQRGQPAQHVQVSSQLRSLLLLLLLVVVVVKP